ncbi:PREDICTED: selenoprotein M-like [Nicrophorus vespilloides]|uniref:Selenoprotein M n=1 Tax=Nicrophorus vespilloides TaxID=110193 RepID=A0ABM1N535_NICVS|nr:PREDICTED: selenoprotein M-like [Nicrophorus vespilloides]
MLFNFPLVLVLGFALCSAEEPTFARARIESCPGCSLNRLPEVKKFIYEDVPKYDGVDFKKIQGAPPELVLLDENDAEVERHILGRLNRKECNELLEKKGFHLKTNAKLEL